MPQQKAVHPSRQRQPGQHGQPIKGKHPPGPGRPGPVQRRQGNSHHARQQVFVPCQCRQCKAEPCQRHVGRLLATHGTEQEVDGRQAAQRPVGRCVAVRKDVVEEVRVKELHAVAQPHEQRRQGRHDAARDRMQQQHRARGHCEADEIEHVQMNPEEAEPEGGEVGRQRAVWVPQVCIQGLALEQFGRDVHLPPAVDLQVRPACPREPEQRGKQGQQDGPGAPRECAVASGLVPPAGVKEPAEARPAGGRCHGLGHGRECFRTRNTVSPLRQPTSSRAGSRR